MTLLSYSSRRIVRSLERLLEENLGTKGEEPSAVQRAICRMVDGTPLGPLVFDPRVIQAFGGTDTFPELGKEFDRILILAGVRCGKSLITALAAIRATQVVDVSRLGPGEHPRVSVVSLTKDNAAATFSHILGTIDAIPVVRDLVIGEPTADSVFLRHPSGRKVEIVVAAGAKAAGSLVSRWFAGVIFDEAPRMDGADEAVVNLDDQLRNLPMRMLPGAHVFMIGSPWAPFGPVYNLVEKTMQGPVPGLLLIKARASWMNPKHFTPEVIERLRVENPDTYHTDELAEFMAPDVGLLSPNELALCTRGDAEWEPPKPRHQYAAAMDPATRGNAWTLAVGTYDGQRWSVVGVKQWIGSTSEPLKPLDVLEQIAGILLPYGVDVVMTDQWGIDAIRDLARPLGLTLIEETLTSAVKVKLFMNLKTHVTDQCMSPGPTGQLIPDGRRKLDIPREPQLVRDLLSVRRRVTQQGLSIELPITSDGRHADFAVCVALLLIHPLSAPLPAPKEVADDDAHMERIRREILARQKKRWKAQLSG